MALDFEQARDLVPPPEIISADSDDPLVAPLVALTEGAELPEWETPEDAEALAVDGSLITDEIPAALPGQRDGDEYLPISYFRDQEANRHAALIAQAQGGNLEAYGQLVAELDLQQRLFKFIYNKCARRELAEDIAQATLLRAIDKIDTLVDVHTNPEAVIRWHMTIARNLYFDYAKSSYNRREVPTENMLDEDGRVASPEREVTRAVGYEIAQQTLASAIARLSVDQQACVQLRFFERLPQAEIARRWGRNESAIKTLQHRAIVRLRKVLEAAGVMADLQDLIA